VDFLFSDYIGFDRIGRVSLICLEQWFAKLFTLLSDNLKFPTVRSKLKAAFFDQSHTTPCAVIYANTAHVDDGQSKSVFN